VEWQVIGTQLALLNKVGTMLCQRCLLPTTYHVLLMPAVGTPVAGEGAVLDGLLLAGALGLHHGDAIQVVCVVVCTSGGKGRQKHNVARASKRREPCRLWLQMAPRALQTDVGTRGAPQCQ